ALANNNEDVRSDSLVKTLVRRRPKMAALDRALYDYVAAETLMAVRPAFIQYSKNPRGRYEAAVRLVELAPGSEFQWKLADAERSLGRLHHAERALLQLDPNASWVKAMDYWGTLADLYYALGDYRGALDVIRRDAHQNGWDVPQLQRQAWMSAMLGNEAETWKSIAAIGQKLNPHEAFFPLMRLARKGAEGLRVSGHAEGAVRLEQWALTVMDTSSAAREFAKDGITAIYVGSNRSVMLYHLGRLAESQAVLERMEERLTSKAGDGHALASDLPDDALVAVYGDLAAIAVRRGDSTRVDRYRQLILAAAPPQNGADKFYLGRIAALQGHRDEAVRLLKEALQLQLEWVTTLREATDLDSLRGYPAFLALLDLPKD
ncbi:MAG: tetratricopeptide repeat protein, partial [Gemmatimonadetes bacterium]|nr:tetratricopeptide repeat protein [Gemmatimonadota bacterium]